MRGFVPTPEAVVDHMVAKLFDGKPPSKDSRVLDPGCGPGAFIAGILRWCKRMGVEAPQIVGCESDPVRHAEAVATFASQTSVTIQRADFLAPRSERFDYVIGNPPYVPITSMNEREKALYRKRFASARGRFDLYLLFFEQSLRLLAAGGRLVFITPEKFLYVKTAEGLRALMATFDVGEIELAAEATFGDLVTYPTITTINARPPTDRTLLVRRDGARRWVAFPRDGASLQPLLQGVEGDERETGVVLADVCRRVSCGLATGLDRVFVMDTDALPDGLKPFAVPTIAGRDLPPGGGRLRSHRSMLLPYDDEGRLLPLHELGELRKYLSAEERKQALSGRTCARKKPWYAFHDSVPLLDIRRPKLLCKDIGETPHFWIDRTGEIVPQHSVYYIVPRDPAKLNALAAYLNGPEAAAWLKAHCQRAANGFLRLQSEVLKRLPVPQSLAPRATALRTVDTPRVAHAGAE